MASAQQPRRSLVWAALRRGPGLLLLCQVVVLPTARVHRRRGVAVHTQQPHLPGYPRLDLGHLSLLCAGNINIGQFSLLCTGNINIEKLARVAICHDLHCRVRHNTEALHDKVTLCFFVISWVPSIMLRICWMKFWKYMFYSFQNKICFSWLKRKKISCFERNLAGCVYSILVLG